MSDVIYKPVPSVADLEVSRDGQFRYNGKPKKAVYSHTVTGRKATVRIIIMMQGKTHYWQAAKLVAESWLYGYDIESDYLTYRDGDCHNIGADNLVIADKREYYEYMQRNSSMKADTLQERKRKLQLVIDEAGITLNYFNTLDMSPINQHVKDYLYTCLMEFSMKTLSLPEKNER